MNFGPEFGSRFQGELEQLFRWRRDVRRFRPNALPKGTLERLVGIANLSPSVGLSQPWRFIDVRSPSARDAIQKNFQLCNSEALSRQSADRASIYASLKLAGLEAAPIQFALFADTGTAKGHGLGRATMSATIEYSAVIALHTLWLAARAEGIGLGWVSILDPSEVARALDAPLEWKLIGYFCLGHPIEHDEVPELERAGWERRENPTLLIR